MAHLGSVLIQLFKSHRAVLAKRLGEIGLFPGQDGLLYHLSVKDGQTMSELVGVLQVQHATLFNMVERMTKAGMVRKGKDEKDRRTSRIYLTRKGGKALSRLTTIWQETEKQLSGNFTMEEKKLLIRMLRKLNTNLMQS